MCRTARGRVRGEGKSRSKSEERSFGSALLRSGLRPLSGRRFRTATETVAGIATNRRQSHALFAQLHNAREGMRHPTGWFCGFGMRSVFHRMMILNLGKTNAGPRHFSAPLTEARRRELLRLTCELIRDITGRGAMSRSQGHTP